MGEKLKRMSDDELREFVNGVCSGQILVSTQVRDESMIRRVFMPVVFGAFDGWTQEELKQIGVLWEWMGKAGPLAVNGLPTFLSCNIMRRDDWERAHAAIVRELKRREEIEV